jgi:hypothetical protein
VTAEQDAIGRAITRLERATVDEPPAYWQVVLDDLEPFVDLETVSNTSIAFKYVMTLRDRTDPARTAEGRAACIADATMFLWQARQFPS